MRKTIILTLVLLVLYTSSVFAVDFEFSRKTLHGLQGIYVLVEKIRPDAEQDGLTGESIQTTVELQLRKAGIKVLTVEEYLKSPGKPNLCIIISTMKMIPEKYYFYNIGVEFQQDVYLERDSLHCGATTWSIGLYGVVPTNKLRRVRTEFLVDQIDIFINVYLEQNPIEIKRESNDGQ